jgi:ribonuclease HI
MLLINQIKGINKVKNIRFVHMMPIIHDLIKHFKTIELDYIPREQNGKADELAKNAASNAVGFTDWQPDLFKLNFAVHGTP